MRGRQEGESRISNFGFRTLRHVEQSKTTQCQNRSSRYIESLNCHLQKGDDILRHLELEESLSRCFWDMKVKAKKNGEVKPLRLNVYSIPMKKIYFITNLCFKKLCLVKPL